MIGSPLRPSPSGILKKGDRLWIALLVHQHGRKRVIHERLLTFVFLQRQPLPESGLRLGELTEVVKQGPGHEAIFRRNMIALFETLSSYQCSFVIASTVLRGDCINDSGGSDCPREGPVTGEYPNE